jgi:hypothetical protein
VPIETSIDSVVLEPDALADDLLGDSAWRDETAIGEAEVTETSTDEVEPMVFVPGVDAFDATSDIDTDIDDAGEFRAAVEPTVEDIDFSVEPIPAIDDIETDDVDSMQP